MMELLPADSPAVETPLTTSERASAAGHIAAITEAQRAASGGDGFVSIPQARHTGRRIDLTRVWFAEVTGALWKRLTDSHKRPGRWGSRLRLLRPFATISTWAVLWLLVAAACVFLIPRTSAEELIGLLARWGFGAALAALLAVIWHDAIRSPRASARIRSRIIEDPAALLQSTLAEQGTKLVELEPPLNTVPRDELYDELLPGVLARTKDVQIVVGVPGAGKTTALLDLAAVLAKIGFMPILLELRGERTREDLFDLAKRRFEKLIRPFVRTSADGDILWRWLCRRQRLVLLIDDIDQIGYDGEPGFLMRRLLENLATEGQAVIVTARPAGVPVGIAASAIRMEPLGFDTAVNLVARPVLRKPEAPTAATPPRPRIERWIRGGRLTESPLYLEALAELTSVGCCPDLPGDPKHWARPERPGRWRSLSRTRREWNPLWVRYMLLDRFYARIRDGRVRPSLAIDRADRQRTLGALEIAALGMLGASGLEAKAAVHHGDQPEGIRTGRPKRKALVDFISSDDRKHFGRHTVDARVVSRRQGISQHEAIDSGERLRILDRDWRGDPQFRHRIMQAFLAGRRLAKLGCREDAGAVRDRAGGASEDRVGSFDDWVEVLMDHHHPEKLTAHLALSFAAMYADEHSRQEPGGPWDGIGERIASELVDAVHGDDAHPAVRSVLLPSLARATDAALLAAAEASLGPAEAPAEEDDLLERLDPMRLAPLHPRRDPDDHLIKLTTAAEIVTLLRSPDGSDRIAEVRDRIIRRAVSNDGAMRWTKLRALPAIAELDAEASWLAIWRHFTRDADYDVRRAASRLLETNACRAYPHLGRHIHEQILRAGRRAADGLPLQSSDGDDSGWAQETFVALGWVLPAIVSGLGEELRDAHGLEAEPMPVAAGGDGADGGGPTGRATADSLDSSEGCFQHSRLRLEELVALAHEGSRHELEESLAQGFKADAMRHVSGGAGTFTGPGWVASNRRLVADVALPHAESWYARMLLYQALALYAIAGTNRRATLELFAHRLHGSRERHPLVRRAATLARAGLRRAELKRGRWDAFLWSDDVEDAGRLPTVLNRRTAQLVGDVAVLVDLKDGSPVDRHANFGHMQELPYCLSASPNRHEILGTGCPDHCGWGFCPFRAASPDEPDEHRGLSRGFCRGQRRNALRQKPPPWQPKVSRRRMYEFWQQMEYKARR